jgi:thioredoxin reductase
LTKYDIVLIGSGPAGMGAAFELAERDKNLSILIIDKELFSTGGMRNDCKMNFTYPIGFPEEYWPKKIAENYLEKVNKFLKPSILEKKISIFIKTEQKDYVVANFHLNCTFYKDLKPLL